VVHQQDWRKLSRFKQLHLYICVLLRYLRLPRFVRCCIIAALGTFVVLPIMPLHPMAIVAAFGWGLCLGIMFA